jgi:hypothetical protein
VGAGEAANAGSERATRSTLVGGAAVSFITVFVKNTPPPKPHATAPTTVPTPKRYDDKDSGMTMTSGVCEGKTRGLRHCSAKALDDHARRQEQKPMGRSAQPGTKNELCRWLVTETYVSGRDRELPAAFIPGWRLKKDGHPREMKQAIALAASR